jgi:hypothetical protein
VFRFNAGALDGRSSLVVLRAGVVALATVVVLVTFAVAVLSDLPPCRVLAGPVVWAPGPLVAGLDRPVRHGLPVHPHANDREYASPPQP